MLFIPLIILFHRLLSSGRCNYKSLLLSVATRHPHLFFVRLVQDSNNMASTQNTSASLRTRVLKTGFHALGTSSFAYSFYLLTTWQSSYSDSFGWYFQLLTVVGLATSLVTFSLGLAADLTLKDVFSRAKNATSVLATPLEVLIAVLYWSIRMHDPALLMPEDLVIDPLPDLGFHLVPAVLLVLDFLLLSRGATITTRGMMLLSTVLAVVYWCWIELCFYQNGW